MRTYLTQMSRFSAYVRTLHFIQLIIDHQPVTENDLSNTESFIKYLNKNNIKRSAGFNRNKRGYLEAVEAARLVLKEGGKRE